MLRLTLAAILMLLPVFGPAAEPAPDPFQPPKKAAAAEPVTTFSKYKRASKTLVQARWAPSVHEHFDTLVKGAVTCSFTLDAQGKLTKFSVTENTSNAAHALLVESVMRHTPFDPPPAELLKDGEFTSDFNFSIY